MLTVSVLPSSGAKLEGVPIGDVQFNSFQRRNLDVPVGEPIKVAPFMCAISILYYASPSSSLPKGEGIYLAHLELEVGFMQGKKQDDKVYKAEQLEGVLQGPRIHVPHSLMKY